MPPLEKLVPPVWPPHLRFLHLSLHLSLSSGAPPIKLLCPLVPPQNKKSGDATEYRLPLKIGRSKIAVRHMHFEITVKDVVCLYCAKACYKHPHTEFQCCHCNQYNV